MKFELDRERWGLIAPYLEQALDLPPEEREALLARLAIEQPTIAATLAELLADLKELEANKFLAEPLSDALVSRPSRAAETVGAYTIESRIGHGGMSEVWLASRNDGRFSGHVAVKFLDARATAASVVDRFRREGKLLARLTHPHIARLIDAGVTAAGQPYLVLEYVQGEPIDIFCERRALGIEARLRLFLDVLAAVAHAHAHLIVHRDIKPSNVLITPAGEVKLLDFGIAKFLARDTGDEDYSAPTRIEDVALTPGYAAPEQILGEPPSTATDVYQLGVLLHVLLTRHLPFEHGGTTRAERVRAALEAEPTRPSDVAAPAWRRQLRGDLDAIVAKALRKRPAERYNSAAALAGDLQRFLNHETVGAREGALAYRARKFVRRYRAAVLGTAVAAVALLLATVFAVLQMREAQAQRDQARFQQKRAEAESQFMTLMMSTVGSGERPVTSGQLLGNGIQLLEHQYGNDPKFQVDMLIRMAARFMDLGETTQQYQALLRAERLASQLHDADGLATIECDAVEPELSLGNPAQAARRLAAGQRALATLRAPTLYSRVECLDAEASLLEAQGDAPAAMRKAEQALGALDAAGANYDVHYTDILSHISQMYWDSGNIKKSFEVAQRDGVILERNGMASTESALSVEHSIAAALMEFGEIRAAFAREHEVIVRQKAASPDGAVIPAIMTTYGMLQLRLDQPDAALRSFETSLAEATRTGDLTSELFARVNRARALLAQGRMAEVEAELANVSRLTAGRETAARRPVARAQMVEAEALLARGELPQAQQQIEAALQKLRAAASSRDALYLGSALLTAGKIASARQHYPEAQDKAQQALNLFEQRARQPQQSADVGEALLLLAKERRAQGDAAGTRALAGRAAQCLDAALGPDHFLTHDALALR